MQKSALIASALTLSLALSACAKIESVDEAQQAATAAQAELDRLAAENAGDNQEEEIIGAPSPGQINTGGETQLAAGSWSVANDGGERMARFGEDGEAPLITIACEVGGGIDIRLPAMEPQGGSETVYLTSQEGGSTLTASAAVGDDPGAYISVPGSDQFVGSLISGSGPFGIRMGGSQRISFPADDVLTSVVSACDRRESAASSDDAAETAPAANASAEASDEGDSE